MRTLEERFDEAEQMMKRPSFRENKGLGNEVGYYVFDYPAQEELYIRERIVRLQTKFKNQQDVELVVFNLYDLMIEVLENKGYLQKTIDLEAKRGLDRVVKAVSSVLKVNDAHGYMIEYIQEHTPDNAIVFLTGIGQCYPLLRSHTILNNLHQVIDRIPVVLFYPGKYDGQELVLFNEVKDDNYYRAFKLVD